MKFFRWVIVALLLFDLVFSFFFASRISETLGWVAALAFWAALEWPGRSKTTDIKVAVPQEQDWFPDCKCWSCRRRGGQT